MLATRLLSAVALIPIVALLVWQGGLFFLVLVAVAGGVALWEFYQMMRAGGFRPLAVVGAVAFALMLIGANGVDRRLQAFAVVVLVLGGLLWELASPEAEGKLQGWALTTAGALYIGWPLAHAVELRGRPDGLWWVMIVLLATWATDTGAYFAGRFFGHHPFSPQYSPKKTWEGVLGGWSLGLVVTALLAWWLLGLSPAGSFVLGLLLGPAAVYGDLAESMLKRRVGVKDSGSLIPGHGGLLDRLDSLLFTAVVTYYFALWFA
ncbi:MAG: phosphatidate cytidylyltransferase [Ardenticatenaceae bacterium]|nr:phosphatidate cytidylyltransferase [Ardenticatenaceae bacterium]HBY94561.1 phosphatidate cytidylyltransferase [Chloroflexota bacterium]